MHTPLALLPTIHYHVCYRTNIITITITITLLLLILVAAGVGGAIQYPFNFKKVSSYSSAAKCGSSNTSDLYVNNIAYTNLYNDFSYGIIVNDEILVHDNDPFNGNDCATGAVTKVNLTSGAVTNTTYIINGLSPVTSGKPIYYDGVHLWLKPKCDSGGSTLYDATTGTNKTFNATLSLYNTLTYGNVHDGQYLYWYDYSKQDVMSYNIGTKTIQSLNLSSQLQQRNVKRKEVFVVYNNKLLWQQRSGLIPIYDLTTKEFSSLSSSDWVSLDSEDTCYTCYNARIASDGSKIILYATVQINNRYRLSGNAFVTITSTASLPVTYSLASILDTTVLKSTVSSQYYVLTPSGQYSAYYDIVSSGTAADCRSGNYYPIDDQHILLSGVPVFFAKSSKPDIFRVGSDDYRVVPLASVPKKCVPSVGLTLVSLSPIPNERDYYYIYSSKLSSKMILLQCSTCGGGNSLTTYSVGSSSTEKPQLSPPPVPSSFSNQYLNFLYPVSVKSEFDYWLAQSSGGCYLISSNSSVPTIKVPGSPLHLPILYYTLS